MIQQSGTLTSEKVLSIDNISPSEENILKSAYPYTFTYYIVYNQEKETDENITKWIEGVRSEYGRTLAEEAGYIANW